MSVCSACNKERVWVDSSKVSGGKKGYYLICNTCKSVKRYSRNYANRNKNYNSLEYKKRKSMQHRINNFESNMLSAIKSSAKKRGLDFNLTIKDIVIPEFCPYLEIKLTRNVGKGKTDSNPSVDRIDNSKGYIRGNVQIISDLANNMKRNASIPGLLIFAKNILKIHS